ncbi:LuxR C-terminal-related transcriptional regulator, partial [Arthrobacter sp. JCM 19049]|uniref:response regulator transcription factor n=1 Tax=Arthrobacter sp. JCM 19049 TaxID=1460643 RepID=UPI002436393D
TWLDATAATRLVQRLRASSAVPTDITEVLTTREQEVLRLVAAGLSNQEIRETLVLSEATVKTMWPGSCSRPGPGTGPRWWRWPTVRGSCTPTTRCLPSSGPLTWPVPCPVASATREGKDTVLV